MPRAEKLLKKRQRELEQDARKCSKIVNFFSKKNFDGISSQTENVNNFDVNVAQNNLQEKQQQDINKIHNNQNVTSPDNSSGVISQIQNTQDLCKSTIVVQKIQNPASNSNIVQNFDNDLLDFVSIDQNDEEIEDPQVLPVVTQSSPSQMQNFSNDLQDFVSIDQNDEEIEDPQVLPVVTQSSPSQMQNFSNDLQDFVSIDQNDEEIEDPQVLPVVTQSSPSQMQNFSNDLQDFESIDQNIEDPHILHGFDQIELDNQESNEVSIVPEQLQLRVQDVWNKKQVEDMQGKYPWLKINSEGGLQCTICLQVSEINAHDLQLSKEWVQGKVYPSGEGRETQLKSLRNKIGRHINSKSHCDATKLNSLKQQDILVSSLAKQKEQQFETTERVFRTAYFVAKQHRPFTDGEKIIDLQKENGLDLGRILHSDKTIAKIIDFLVNQMREKIVFFLITYKPKLSVAIDESTSLSKKTCLIIYFRSCFDEDSDPLTIFWDIIELQSTDAQTIFESMFVQFQKQGLNMQFFEE
eukprot:TRINITY_DN5514_c1_g1_i1.p1 TRINITY_DN5514_c1_g1~~TRINITY_DN5514_c1_g1_i1.p1  ORF type:complete len:523 (-),score=74.48 TRINITY_DN5514_c1_g1_i1:87-1655(-)